MNNRLVTNKIFMRKVNELIEAMGGEAPVFGEGNNDALSVSTFAAGMNYIKSNLPSSGGSDSVYRFNIEPTTESESGYILTKDGSEIEYSDIKEAYTAEKLILATFKDDGSFISQNTDIIFIPSMYVYDDSDPQKIQDFIVLSYAFIEKGEVEGHTFTIDEANITFD